MNFWSKLYKTYFHEVFPKIEHIRGTTKLANLLNRLSLRSLDRIPESQSESIFEKDDWDNLVIIDACRHDLYEEVYGETNSRYSLGSCSSDYVEKTFSEGDFSDIVYITANPHLHESKFENLTGRKAEEVFHEVFHTYETDWNHEKGTVMPEPLVRDAKTAKKLFPDKRLIVHFMQPHHPFVGAELGKGISQHLEKNVKKRNEEEVWMMAERGEIKRGEVWKNYKKNLEFVMDYVKELDSSLQGETFVTADHGNLVGENGRYAHPCGVRTESLLKVPWTQV